MKSDTIVIAEDSLFVVGTARILTLQYVMYFIVFMELVEVLELLNLSSIVTKYFIEKQITILETSYVDGNNGYTFLK